MIQAVRDNKITFNKRQTKVQGIVSRALHMCFWYHAIRVDLSSYTPNGTIRLLRKFNFRVEIFNFRISA
jgi:hypothetical protein